ncbi:carbohydrate ABC transporter permease [Streptomyces sp. SP17KL33]|uniref:carbohydrate ABC transporter permease n=1 Tax=Streptomyces sp. SP17KL33 TaxID=3002534 RepID=UPI002E79663C|nr:sugar ABC transporter permease [Streptomyces sp. SP17KL33]MEE1832494.1 sugar ABC transporter permease [Streptomyces sp. SP17KL33]
MAVHDISVRALGDRREQAPEGAAPPGGPGRKRRRGLRSLEPLLWLGPAVVLILAMVVWPVVEMVRTSLTRISSTGLPLGSAGLDNYADLFGEEELPGVLLRTLVWVVGVVAVTLLLSLGLAQLLNARFPGQRLVRWALIVPWAASVLMTALIWRWMLNNFYGVVNRVLMDVGLLDEPVNWLADPVLGFAAMMAVAVFVSLPFTAFVILSGLQTVPAEVYEAARMDGAGPVRTYLLVTLPLLRPSLLVAAIINIINVFNSFPIIWSMTRGGPGFATDTTTTFMYKLAFDNQAVGESAAMAVVNFALILVVVLAYLRVVRWREEIR